MMANLIAELIKIGIPYKDITKNIAKVLGITEKTVRNKLNGLTEWTLQEAITINEHFFEGKQDIEKLFEKITKSYTA